MYNVFRDEIFSEEWCNLLFEDRNREYGAYRLRRERARRHAYGVLGVVLLVGALGLLQWSSTFFEKATKIFLNTELPVIQLNPLEAEEGHEVKTIAAGRSVSRPVAPKGEVMDVPEVVEGFPPAPDFGTEAPQLLEEAGQVYVQEVPETEAHNAEREDLPEEGAMLTPVEVVEQMPRYPGGIGALMRFLDERIPYPAIMAGEVTGDMELTFLVDKDGTVREPEVSTSLHPDLDRAALEALKAMPRWKPGMVNGRVSLVRVRIPVHFQKQ